MIERNGQHERSLVLVVHFASALSLGTLAAVIYSVKAVTPQIRFAFSIATLVAFAVAVLGSIAFWYLVFALSDPGSEQNALRRRARQAWFRVLATLLILGLIFGFIYPLRGFSREKVSEIGFGSGVALGFLTVLGLIFWRVVRYLEADNGR